MVEEQNPLPPSVCKYNDPKEEQLTYIEGNIFNPILSVTDLIQLKDNILEKSSVGRDKLNLCETKLVHLCLPQVHHFPQFVTWGVQNYSESRRVFFVRG